MAVSSLTVRWLVALSVLAIAVVLSACSDSPVAKKVDFSRNLFWHPSRGWRVWVVSLLGDLHTPSSFHSQLSTGGGSYARLHACRGHRLCPRRPPRRK